MITDKERTKRYWYGFVPTMTSFDKYKGQTRWLNFVIRKFFLNPKGVHYRNCIGQTVQLYLSSSLSSLPSDRTSGSWIRRCRLIRSSSSDSSSDLKNPREQGMFRDQILSTNKMLTNFDNWGSVKLFSKTQG